MTLKWSSEETASLREMRQNGVTSERIAEHLGRTLISVKERWRTINRTKEQLRSRADRAFVAYQSTIGQGSVIAKWTDEETERARKLLDAGADDATFRAELGRTKGSAKSRVAWIKLKESGRRTTRENRKDPDSRRPERMVVPQQLWDEAARRSSAPNSLTGSFFGDPPQGFSALERRA